MSVVIVIVVKVEVVFVIESVLRLLNLDRGLTFHFSDLIEEANHLVLRDLTLEYTSLCVLNDDLLELLRLLGLWPRHKYIKRMCVRKRAPGHKKGPRP